MKKIKIGICGYGNLGKGVELALNNNDDMELVAVFTRRNPKEIKANLKSTKIVSINEIKNYKNKIDVMIMCGGSKTDLPIQSIEAAKNFNIIDSFDNHADIYNHFNKVDNISKQNNTLSLISCGWDPGLFSLMRTLFTAILPDGINYVFYGKGLSQGHSDAIRRIKGVKKAVQYTVPYIKAVNSVKKGKMPIFKSVRDMMWRDCYVVLDKNANKLKIEKEIKEMPNYFANYNTKVHFIEEDEFDKKHCKMTHGGFISRNGKTNENKHVIEFSLNLDSNPEFTASVLVAYARALYKLKENRNVGALTVLDIPIKYLINKEKNIC